MRKVHENSGARQQEKSSDAVWQSKTTVAQFFTPKVEAVAVPNVLSEKSHRPGRPEGILESRPRLSLKRFERAGQDRPHERVSPGFLVVHSHTHFGAFTAWDGAGEDLEKTSNSGAFTVLSNQLKQRTSTTAATVGPKARSQSNGVQQAPTADDSGSSSTDA